MTGIISVTLVCDGYPGGQPCQSDTPNMDLGMSTVGEARRQARDQNWLTAQPGGKDFCPDCQAAGIALASNLRERFREQARQAARRRR